MFSFCSNLCLSVLSGGGYEYGAFYRLIRVINRSTSNAVTEYAYNGLGHRVSEINDSDADGSMADETPTWFAYDERWRIVASYEGAADPEEPDEIFVHHRAGQDGHGTSSYIDSVALRLRDTTGSSPHTLDETSYYCQNWRADVVALIDESRNQLEQVRYSPYGVPFLLPAGDVTGVWGEADIDDRDVIVDHYVNTSYDVRADLDLDGDVDVDDISAYAAGSGGRGTLSLAANGNRLGYAGYTADTHIEGSAWHVRHRVLVSTTGQWTARDPLGYVDGPSLYQYVRGNPVNGIDPMGLLCQYCPVGTGICCGDSGDPLSGPSGIDFYIPDYFPGDPWGHPNRPANWPPCYPWDAEIEAAYQAAMAACPGIAVDWGIDDQPGFRPGDSCNGTLDLQCFGPRGSDPASLKTALLHELMHMRTACESYGLCGGAGGTGGINRSQWNNLDNTICNELRSYCAEPRRGRGCTGDIPSNPQLANGLCGQACDSIFDIQDEPRKHQRCVTRCLQIYTQCVNGKYVRPVVPPTRIIWNPYPGAPNPNPGYVD